MTTNRVPKCAERSSAARRMRPRCLRPGRTATVERVPSTRPRLTLRRPSSVRFGASRVDDLPESAARRWQEAYRPLVGFRPEPSMTEPVDGRATGRAWLARTPAARAAVRLRREARSSIRTSGTRVIQLAREAVEVGALPTRDVFAHHARRSRRCVHHGSGHRGLLLCNRLSPGGLAAQASASLLFRGDRRRSRVRRRTARGDGSASRSSSRCCRRSLMSWIPWPHRAIRAQVATALAFSAARSGSGSCREVATVEAVGGGSPPRWIGGGSSGSICTPGSSSGSALPRALCRRAGCPPGARRASGAAPRQRSPPWWSRESLWARLSALHFAVALPWWPRSASGGPMWHATAGSSVRDLRAVSLAIATRGRSCGPACRQRARLAAARRHRLARPPPPRTPRVRSSTRSCGALPVPGYVARLAARAGARADVAPTADELRRSVGLGAYRRRRRFAA